VKLAENLISLKKAAKSFVNENFFHLSRTLSLPFNIQNNNINNSANTTLYYLKTFAEFKKTNTANCKDREKERGGRALS
jgi:hypothetical protein